MPASPLHAGTRAATKTCLRLSMHAVIGSTAMRILHRATASAHLQPWLTRTSHSMATAAAAAAREGPAPAVPVADLKATALHHHCIEAPLQVEQEHTRRPISWRHTRSNTNSSTTVSKQSTSTHAVTRPHPLAPNHTGYVHTPDLYTRAACTPQHPAAPEQLTGTRPHHLPTPPPCTTSPTPHAMAKLMLVLCGSSLKPLDLNMSLA